MQKSNAIQNQYSAYKYIEQQQVLADVERLTSDQADLVTRLKCYEEDLRGAYECKYSYKLRS